MKIHGRKSRATAHAAATACKPAYTYVCVRASARCAGIARLISAKSRARLTYDTRACKQSHTAVNEIERCSFSFSRISVRTRAHKYASRVRALIRCYLVAYATAPAVQLTRALVMPITIYMRAIPKMGKKMRARFLPASDGSRFFLFT